MSFEKVEGLHPDLLEQDLGLSAALLSAGFEPYIAGAQTGFSVQKQADGSSAVFWYPQDWESRPGTGVARYRSEERTTANHMHRAYASHLREVAEEAHRLGTSGD